MTRTLNVNCILPQNALLLFFLSHFPFLLFRSLLPFFSLFSRFFIRYNLHKFWDLFALFIFIRLFVAWNILPEWLSRTLSWQRQRTNPRLLLVSIRSWFFASHFCWLSSSRKSRHINGMETETFIKLVTLEWVNEGTSYKHVNIRNERNGFQIMTTKGTETYNYGIMNFPFNDLSYAIALRLLCSAATEKNS